jgi:mono/diheme cytochrome c family protein
MKKTTILSALIVTAFVALVSCSDVKRTPGSIYMPDMAYSRAYETYAMLDSTMFTGDATRKGDKIYYNGMPVKGTMRRGELTPYTVPNDSNGLIYLSANVKNPLPTLSTKDSLEAARLYNINCGVCHGAKAEANGPIAERVGGVKNIISASTGASGDPAYSDGRIFHILTYGQNNMGSYASQLSREQRWMIVHYIRSLEPKKAAATATTAAATSSTPAATTAKDAKPTTATKM